MTRWLPLLLLVQVASAQTATFNSITVGTPSTSEYYVTGHYMMALQWDNGASRAAELAWMDDLGIDAMELFHDTGFYDTGLKAWFAAAVTNGSAVKMSPAPYGNAIDSGDSLPWDAWVQTLVDLDGASYAGGWFLEPASGLRHMSSYSGLTNIYDLASESTVVAANGTLFLSGVPNSSLDTEAGIDSAFSTYGAYGWDGLTLFTKIANITTLSDLNTHMADAATTNSMEAGAMIQAQYLSSPFFHDGWGYKRLKATWDTAYSSGAKRATFVTFNDSQERTRIIPINEADLPVTLSYWNQASVPSPLSHEGFAEYSKRYIQRHKTRSTPAITTDEMFFSYRLHSREVRPYAELDDWEVEHLRAWIPQDATGLSTFYASTPGSLSDGWHLVVRLTATADVKINGVLVGDDVAAGETELHVPGSLLISATETNGYPQNAFTSADYGHPLFEIERSAATVLEYRGELPVTDFPAPGHFDVLARKAVANRLTAYVEGVYDGEQLYGSRTLTGVWGGDTQVFDHLEFWDGTNQIGGDITAAPWQVTWSPSAGSYSVTVRAYRGDETYEESPAADVVVPASGTTFDHASVDLMVAQDIGSMSLATSFGHAAGEFTIASRGNDGSNVTDELGYVWRKLTGNSTVVVRLDSLPGGGYAGLMWRNSLSPSAAMGFVAGNSATTGDYCIVGGGRSSAGGNGFYLSDSVNTFAFPKWLRMVRTGTSIQRSYSSDGSSWTNFGSAQTCASTCYIGLFCRPESTTNTRTATFSELSMTSSAGPNISVEWPQAGWSFASGDFSNFDVHVTTDALAVSTNMDLKVDAGTVDSDTTPDPSYMGSFDPGTTAGAYDVTSTLALAGSLSADSSTVPFFIRAAASVSGWTGYSSRDLGPVWVEGSASYSGGTVTLTGGGRDIDGGVDGGRYGYKTTTGDATYVARVNTLTGSDGWRKAGILLRSSLDPDAQCVGILVSGSNGIVTPVRYVDGMRLSQANPTGFAAPYYVRVAKSGNTYTLARSSDGSSWTTISTYTVSLPSTYYVGLWVSSHDAGFNDSDGTPTTAEATFDNLSGF